MGKALGNARTIFSDDFNGPLSGAKWDYNHWQPHDNPSFYGRTQQRQSLPETANGVLRLKLDTYNPQDPKHETFVGSEAITRDKFSTRDGGIAFEVKARFVDVPKGVVAGMFTFGGTAKKHDEIDWEALSNQLKKGEKQIQTNIYADEPLGAGHVKFVPTGSALDKYHVYRIEWLKNEVRWLIDGKEVRVEKVHVPKGEMALHLNLWAPSKGWGNAFDASLKPAARPGQNKTYTFDVDSVKVFGLSTKYGGDGNNSFKGTHVADRMEGGDGRDVIEGRQAADVLKGGRDGDRLYGNRGADELHGGAGKDILKGGRGTDTFVFDSKLGPNNVDRINDFKPGVDRIELSHDVFAAVGPAGKLAAGAFEHGDTALDADDRILYDDATGFLFYDKDGADGAAAVLFAKLAPGLDLGAADFVIA